MKKVRDVIGAPGAHEKSPGFNRSIWCSLKKLKKKGRFAVLFYLCYMYHN